MKRLEEIEADLAETVQRQTEFFIRRQKRYEFTRYGNFRPANIPTSSRSKADALSMSI